MITKGETTLTLFDDKQDLCILFQGNTIARVKREAIGFAKKFVAAPEMYEALKEAQEIIDWVLRKQTGYISDIHKDVGGINKQVKQALALAEGKEGK